MKAYAAYCKKQIAEKISDMCKTFYRVDVVFDIYKEMSLKQETREGQSKGDVLRTLLCHDTQNQHSKILTILQVNENKNKLLELIADCDAEQCKEAAVIATKGEKIVSNTLREKCPNTEISLVRIFPYSD